MVDIHDWLPVPAPLVIAAQASQTTTRPSLPGEKTPLGQRRSRSLLRIENSAPDGSGRCQASGTNTTSPPAHDLQAIEVSHMVNTTDAVDNSISGCGDPHLDTEHTTIQTLKQFEETLRTQAIIDYSITGEEYDEHYPRGSRLQEWYATVVQAARDRRVTPAPVLDTVAAHVGAYHLDSLLHAYPHSVPDGYIRPAMRT